MTWNKDSPWCCRTRATMRDIPWISGTFTLELVWFGRAGYDGMSGAVVPEEKIAIIPGFIMHSNI